jgi:hypothetical protein
MHIMLYTFAIARPPSFTFSRDLQLTKGLPDFHNCNFRFWSFLKQISFLIKLILIHFIVHFILRNENTLLKHAKKNDMAFLLGVFLSKIFIYLADFRDNFAGAPTFCLEMSQVMLIMI